MTAPAELLLKQAKTVDPQAFGALYGQYAPELYRYALCVLGTPADAQDAVQDAAVRVYENLQNIRDPRRFKAYFFKTLSNTCKTMLKRRALTLVDEQPFENLQSPHSTESDAILRADLKAALERLSETERTVVLLSAIGGLSSREIADAVGLTAGSTRSKLSRALGKMRKYMREHGE